MELREVVLIALPFIVAITLGLGFLLVFRERAAAHDVLRRRAQLAEPDLATPLRDPSRRSAPGGGTPGCGSPLPSSPSCSGSSCGRGCSAACSSSCRSSGSGARGAAATSTPGPTATRSARTPARSAAERASARTGLPRVGRRSRRRSRRPRVPAATGSGRCRPGSRPRRRRRRRRGARRRGSTRRSPGEEQQGTLQEPELRRRRERREREVVRPEREPEQRERADPLVLERLPQRNARAERPPEHERGTLGSLADARRSRPARRAARRGRRRSVPPEPIVPRKLKTRTAKPRLPASSFRTDHRTGWSLLPPCRGWAWQITADPRGGSSGRRSSPSSRTPSSVRNVTVSTSATMPAMGELRQPRGTAFTIRDPLPWPDVAGDRARGRGARLRGRVPAGDRRSRHARDARRGSRGRPSGCSSGPA